MQNKNHVAVDAELFPKREYELPMLGIGVTVGILVEQLVRVAHADQIAGD